MTVIKRTVTNHAAMENECAEHICIDMEILLMTKLIMPLQACYPGALMNSIEKALESERAIISGGHLMYFSPQQNCHSQCNIFPRVILNRRDAHRIPIQHVLHREFALMTL